VQVKGNHKVKAPRQQVWEALNRPDLLRRCTPGCKQLEVRADGAFAVLLEVGVGSVKGRYAGKIEITDRDPGSRYKLAVSGNGTIGFLNAEGVIELADEEGETRIEYSGEAHVGGPVAGVGQRVMDGVSKLLVGQFFRCFEKALLDEPAVPTGPSADDGEEMP